VESYSVFVLSPILAPFAIDIMKGLPVSDVTVSEAFAEAVGKEVSCCETERRRESRFNYEPFFDPFASYEQVHPLIAANPTMSYHIRRVIQAWKEEVEGKTFFPSSTDKSMSMSTRRAYGEFTGHVDTTADRKSRDWDFSTPVQFTQRTWLQVYNETGEQLGGETEVRKRWYPSSTKPRVYYAQGGNHYAVSQHLQDILRRLVDGTPMTHHQTRLIPTQIRLKARQHLRIYDFTSFTSGLEELQFFTERLAQYCSGTIVYFFDVRQGKIPVDLGYALERYNREANCCPDVSYERVAKSIGMIKRDMVSQHNQAGMLGVYGNMVTSTFLHGAVMSQFLETEDQGQFAGDDGAIAENDDDFEQEHCVDCVAGDLGIFSPEKSFTTREPPCICLKRPLFQLGSRLETKTFIIPPSMFAIRLAVEGVEFSDSRFPIYDLPDMRSRWCTVGKQLFRYLCRLHRLAHLCSEIELLYALDFAREVTKLASRSGADVWFDGRLPNVGDSYFWPVVPDELDELIHTDPVDMLIQSRYDGRPVRLTKRGKINRVRLGVPLVEPGDEIVCCGDGWLKCMVNLGYIEASEEKYWIEGEEAYHHLAGVFRSEVPKLYRFEVLKSIPENLCI
jgi:hypothetical protein